MREAQMISRSTGGMRRKHTSYRPDFLRVLASDEEDDVPLASVDIVVFEKEDLVDAVLL